MPSPCQAGSKPRNGGAAALSQIKGNARQQTPYFWGKGGIHPAVAAKHLSHTGPPWPGAYLRWGRGTQGSSRQRGFDLFPRFPEVGMSLMGFPRLMTQDEGEIVRDHHRETEKKWGEEEQARWRAIFLPDTGARMLCFPRIF